MKGFEEVLDYTYEPEGIEDFIGDRFWQEKHQTTPRLTKARHTSISAPDSMLCITNGSSVELFALVMRRSLSEDVSKKGVNVSNLF